MSRVHYPTPNNHARVHHNSIHATILPTHPVHNPGAQVGHRVTAAIATGKHPDPSRTRKLSLPAPMVLPPRGGGRVGRRRTTLLTEATPAVASVALGGQTGSPTRAAP